MSKQCSLICFLGSGGFGSKLSYISDDFVLFNSRNKTELSDIVSVVCC